MNVFVIGATGYLGGAAARRLQRDGHHVVAAVRSEEAAGKAAKHGFETVRADVSDPQTLLEPARHADAVIYAVQLQQPDAEAVDGGALTAVIDALSGSDKAFVYTSGCWYYGSTGDRIADEETPANPPPLLLSRPRLERIVFDSADRAVRAIVLRPGDVYGNGGGLPGLFVHSAREAGVARTIGDGGNHWPVVHVDDLADLYALAMARASAGDVFNASDDTAFTQKEIAAAASRGAGKDGATQPWPVEEARAAMGDWIEALAMDQRVTSVRRRLSTISNAARTPVRRASRFF